MEGGLTDSCLGLEPSTGLGGAGGLGGGGLVGCLVHEGGGSINGEFTLLYVNVPA